MARNLMYSGKFESLKGDEIEVEIRKEDFRGVVGDLIFSGDEPVVVEYCGGDVFCSVRSSVCSVRVVCDSPLFLHSGVLTDVDVKVWRDGVLMWYGFLRPNVFDMPWDVCNNVLELEFVDVLGVLGDVKFRRYGGEFFDTFEGYVKRAMEVLGCGDVVKYVEGLDEWEGIGVMQRNFIDESQDEVDGSMSWLEVLESIGLYVGRTFYMWGESVMCEDLLDSGESIRQLGSMVKSGGESSVSMTDVYKKVTVVANNNPCGDAVSDVLDTVDWVEQDRVVQFGGIGKGYMMVGYMADQSQYGERSGVHSAGDDGVERYWLLNAAYSSKKWDVSEKVELVSYGLKWVDGLVGLDSASGGVEKAGVPWRDMLKWESLTSGGLSGGIASGLGSSYYCLQRGHVKGSWLQRYASVSAKGVTSSLSWNECLTLGGDGSKAVLKDCPYFVGEGGYFLLRMSFMMSYWAYPQGEVMGFEIDCDDSKPLRLKCRLSVGDWKWNGSAWVNGSSGDVAFYVGWTSEDGKYVTGSEVSIDNDVSWGDGVNTNGEGDLIALPSDKVLCGELKFEVENCNDNEQHMGLSYYHVTELGLEYVRESDVVDVFDLGDGSADVKYSGQIDDDCVSEMDDVEMRVNTWTSRETSLSYVMVVDGSGYKYVKPGDGEKCQEEKLIGRLIGYYKKGRLIYDVGLEEWSDVVISPRSRFWVPGLNRSMVVGGLRYDLGDSSCEVRLLELM